MRLEVTPDRGRLSITLPTLPGEDSDTLTAWVSFRFPGEAKLNKTYLHSQDCRVEEEAFIDVHGAGTQRTLRTQPGGAGLSLSYCIRSYDQRPFLLIRISALNEGSGAIQLQEFCLAESVSAMQILSFDHPSSLRFFKVGWHGWDFTGTKLPGTRNACSWADRLTSASYSNPVTPKPHRPDEYWSEGWGMLASAKACLVAGLVSTASQFGQVYSCTRPHETAFRMVTQLDGVCLSPGEKRDSEWGFIQLVELPHPEPMAEYVEAVARQMDARVPATPPPMWTHWYHFYHDISEQKLLETAYVLASHRSDLLFTLIELDDGYQSAWGDWTTTNDKFPHGLSWLAERIKAGGFTPGLWLAPFVVHSRSRIARQHPDWLVKNKRGKPTFAAFVYNLVLNALDLTNPEVLDYLQQLASELTHKMGYEMLKIDFINSAALPGRRMNPKLTRAEALRAGLQAIRQGAGEQVFLLGSGCPFGPAIGLLDSMRIGPDTAPSWEPYFNWLTWAGPLVKSNPSMPSLRNALRNTLNLSSLHRRWWWNDPDCLLVREGDTRLTEAEVQSAITLVGLSGGLFVVSDDLQKVSTARLRWVSKLVPNLGLRGLALDLLESEMPTSYRAKLEQGGQAWQLVALFNWADQPADISLRFSDLGYPVGTRLHLFDFWQGAYQSTEAPEVVYASIPAHGCKLVRVCKAGEGIQVVGDTLHISQGKELVSLRIVDDNLEIVTMEMGRHVQGELWLSLKEEPGGALFNGVPAMLEQQDEGVYLVKINR
ncbi:MAG: hypothetical protein C3F13_14255 [Anaerolineales bacterium]|nr:MAG: hypothetical protein C3F13_14255 [Anaerolineales bacterium]